jgi:hypothetical protein
MSGPPSFYQVLTEAINDMMEHGFDSVERLAGWITRIREAAERSLTPAHVLEDALRNTFTTTYKRLVEREGILKQHPGVPLFTLARVKPKLHAELVRRTAASADLIVLNRQASIEKTVQRFAGWGSSVPPGGSEATSRPEAKREIRKALASLPFEERRVMVDQGHKFVANLNEIIANDGGALAAEWHSHWRQLNYHYRKDHKERDQHVYLIRDSWAHQAGLVKPGDVGYYDDITKPGTEIFCRCWVTYLYALRRLPPDMLTQKGKEELARVKLQLGA